MNYFDKGELPDYENSKSGNDIYIMDDGLKGALEVALELNMPLLISGEPGTGKTRFAYHVAQNFKRGDVLKFNAKTTSLATDIFYSYNALLHYRLSHKNAGIDNWKKTKDWEDAGVIKLGPLGEAVRKASNGGGRSIVLIDEIDKAPRDFPNDLLDVLEGDFSFKIPEASLAFPNPGEDKKPIIIITSNSEKTLPAPFLRRCVYYHIKYPEPDQLYKIVSKKLSAAKTKTYSDKDLLFLAEKFEGIRDIAEQYGGKKPATAEFISWVVMLKRLNIMVDDLKNMPKSREQKVLASLSVIAKSKQVLDAIANHFNIEG